MNDPTTPASPIRLAHRWLAALIAAGVATQFVLAGAGAFGATSFQAHTAVGWMIGLASMLALLVAVVGRSELRATAAHLARRTAARRPGARRPGRDDRAAPVSSSAGLGR